MTWRDRIDDAVGSFRGVGFHVERTSADQGRRVQVHEYPLRDRPYAEDLGRKKREWTIEAYLIGDDYDLQRDQLLEAVELPGAGELVHPYYGRRRVVITGGCRVRESTRNGGMANISFTVVEADDTARLPRASMDTAAVVEDAAEAARTSILADFIERFDTLDLAADRVAEVQSAVDDTLDGLDAAIGNVTGPLAELIRSPADFGGAVLGFIAQVSDTVGEPSRALQIYEDLFDAGDDPAVVSASAPEALQKQAAAVRATNDLVRRGAVVQAAGDAAQRDYAAADDAIAARRTITAGIDEQLARDSIPADQVYTDLTALRAAVVTDLDERGAALPRLTTYTTRDPLPALVVAQRLYGDATRADEIVERNRITHPGRVPGGKALEVLSE